MHTIHEDLKKSLQKKGWQQHHIDRAVATLQHSHHVKSSHVKFLDGLIYWFALLLAVFGNFIISIALIPVFVVFTKTWLLITLTVVALAFGYLLDIMIREIEHLQKNHLIIPELFIPAIGIINIYVITKLANTYSIILQTGTNHDPWTTSIAFVIAFSVPHYVVKWRKMRKKA
jgi:hypothetical protein